MIGNPRPLQRLRHRHALDDLEEPAVVIEFLFFAPEPLDHRQPLGQMFVAFPCAPLAARQTFRARACFQPATTFEDESSVRDDINRGALFRPRRSDEWWVRGWWRKMAACDVACATPAA